MSSDAEHDDWKTVAWAALARGDHASAREIADSVLAQARSEERAEFRLAAIRVSGGSVSRRAEDVSDAEEVLAGVALMTGDADLALAHVHKAILYSERFRVGAHLLASTILTQKGDHELAATKLNAVAAFSDDIALRVHAAAQAVALRSSSS
ncbi:MAG: hypothetical protein ACXVFQ_21360 [Solirubrobacteraceae bacterium]